MAISSIGALAAQDPTKVSGIVQSGGLPIFMGLLGETDIDVMSASLSTLRVLVPSVMAGLAQDESARDALIQPFVGILTGQVFPLVLSGVMFLFVVVDDYARCSCLVCVCVLLVSLSPVALSPGRPLLRRHFHAGHPYPLTHTHTLSTCTTHSHAHLRHT